MWFWQKNDMKSAYGVEHYFQEPSSPLLFGMVDHESLWGSRERRGENTEINKKMKTQLITQRLVLALTDFSHVRITKDGQNRVPVTNCFWAKGWQ